MRAVIGILLALLAAGCTKEIRRGEFRPDGSQYVSGGMAGKKKRAPSFFEKLRGSSGKPVAATAKPVVIRAGQGAAASAQPAETEKARSFWDWLFRRKRKAKERPAPKEGK